MARGGTGCLCLSLTFPCIVLAGESQSSMVRQRLCCVPGNLGWLHIRVSPGPLCDSCWRVQALSDNIFELNWTVWTRSLSGTSDKERHTRPERHCVTLLLMFLLEHSSQVLVDARVEAALPPILKPHEWQGSPLWWGSGLSLPGTPWAFNASFYTSF